MRVGIGCWNFIVRFQTSIWVSRFTAIICYNFSFCVGWSLGSSDIVAGIAMSYLNYIEENTFDWLKNSKLLLFDKNTKLIFLKGYQCFLFLRFPWWYFGQLKSSRIFREIVLGQLFHLGSKFWRDYGQLNIPAWKICHEVLG